MKLSLIALGCFLALGNGFAQTFEGQHVTGADLARALDLNPEDYGVRKFQVDLGARKAVTVRYSFGREVRTWKLEGKSRVLTILINEPNEGERVRTLMFWVDGESDVAQAFFDFDSTRTKRWEVGYVNGVFTIAVGPEKPMAEGEEPRKEAWSTPSPVEKAKEGAEPVEYKIEILGET